MTLDCTAGGQPASGCKDTSCKHDGAINVTCSTIIYPLRQRFQQSVPQGSTGDCSLKPVWLLMSAWRMPGSHQRTLMFLPKLHLLVNSTVQVSSSEHPASTTGPLTAVEILNVVSRSG